MNLREWRIRKNLTQGELAEKLGTNQKSYSAYETGRTTTPGTIQAKLRKMGYEGPWPHEQANDATAAAVSAEEFWKLAGRVETLERTILALSPGLDAVKNLDERVQKLEHRKASSV